jgi:transcription termination/antitermination protein NusA
MINNIQNIVEQLCLEHKLPEDFIYFILQEGIKKAWAHDAGEGYDIGLSIQNSKFGHTLRCFRKLKIVEIINNPLMEISFIDAKNINNIYNIGDIVEEEIALNSLSRTAVSIVEHYLMENIQFKKKQNEFEYFSPKIGEIFTCIVKAISSKGVVVNIEGFEGIITDYNSNHFLKSEFIIGAKIKAYLYNVEQNDYTFQVFLSRNNAEFLIGMFSEVIPEVKNGIIEIFSVARNPGFAAIVLVKSNDSNINPVSACVGSGGNRIKDIRKEIRDKIYIIPWQDHLFLRINSIVSYSGEIPIKKILMHEEDEENKFIEIFVDNEYAKRIIGPKGRNIDLISRALNYKIKVINIAQQEVTENILNDEDKKQELLHLQEVLDLTLDEVTVLSNLNIYTIADLLKIPFKEFIKIPLPNNNHGLIYNKILTYKEN